MATLTIITHAPQGTLGDPALCDHLVQSLQKRYPEVKIKLVITSIDQVGHWRAVDGIIKKNDKLTVTFLPGIIQDLTTQQKQELYSNTDAVIIYPTFHFMSPSERVELDEVRKRIPVLYITNYNFQEQVRYNRTNKTFCDQNPTANLQSYEQLLEQGLILETGLVNDQSPFKLLGINVEHEPKDITVDLDHKDSASLNESDKKSIQGVLKTHDDELSNAALVRYKQTHDLYLAYYNNLNLEAKTNWQNAPSFVKTCVLYSLRRNKLAKNIDIVLPLKTQSDSKNNLTEVLRQLDLDLVTVEYWQKNPENDLLVLHSSVGRGKTVVRLINAFPFERNGMDLMERIADPFTLVTGNSSLAEAIEYHKIFLYQVMSWHTRLDKDFYEVMTDDTLFMPSHPYRKFFEIVHSNLENKETHLVELLLNHQEELVAGAKSFCEYLNKYHNLKKSLPQRLMASIAREQARITSIPKTQPLEEQSTDPFFVAHQHQFENKLLKFKENLKYDDADKDDLLLLAFMLKDDQTARTLLQLGANPNVTRLSHARYYNPLYFCLTYNLNESLLCVLTEHPSFDPLGAVNAIRKNAKCKPYKKLQEGFPCHRMVENLIKSTQRKNQKPRDLFNEKELQRFCSRSIAWPPYYDLIYVDMFFSADILRPLNFLYDIKKFYQKNYAHRLLQRGNLKEVLNAFIFDNGVSILENSYQKYREDIPYLRKVLFQEPNNDSCLIVEYLAHHDSSMAVRDVASKILSPGEFAKCLEAANKKRQELEEATFEADDSGEYLSLYKLKSSPAQVANTLETMSLSQNQRNPQTKPGF